MVLARPGPADVANITAAPELDQAVLQLCRALIAAEVLPFRRWFCYWRECDRYLRVAGFLAFRNLQQGARGLEPSPRRCSIL